MTDVAAFGDQVIAHRLSAGLSQEALAIRSGLSVRAVSNLEKGRTRWPHPATVSRLADALGLHDPARAQFIAATPRRFPPAAPDTLNTPTVLTTPAGAAIPAAPPAPATPAGPAIAANPATPAIAANPAGPVGPVRYDRRSEDGYPHVIPRQLPAPPAQFACREPELATLEGLLSLRRPDAPVTAVIGGTAGVGKTKPEANTSNRYRAVT